MADRLSTWTRPAHEAPVTRDIFEAASTVGRFRKGSRSAAGTSTHPSTARTYILRSYLRCDLCNHRTYGSTRKAYVYYRCTPNARNHAHMPWYPDHPRYVLVREDELIEPLAHFFDVRVFGASWKILLEAPSCGPLSARSRRRLRSILGCSARWRQPSRPMHNLCTARAGS
jgi:site-specific DNA recombinase